MTIAPTPDNVYGLLQLIGCKGQHGGRYGEWERVYIHATVPIANVGWAQVGRVMFQNGQFRWVKWYRAPSGWLDEHYDRPWFSWLMLLETGKPIDDLDWAMLFSMSKMRAIRAREDQRRARVELDIARARAGKPLKRRKSVGPPNQALHAIRIINEMVGDKHRFGLNSLT